MFHARKNQSCTIIVNLVIKRLENMNLDNQQKLQSLKHFFYKSLRKANQNIFIDFQSSIVICEPANLKWDIMCNECFVH
jgi:hypothetical protein